MAKIIKIEGDIVSIGTENGGIDEVRFCDLQFYPEIGDEVEIFKTETKTVVAKVEKKSEVPNNGININVQNATNIPQQTLHTSGKAVSKVVYCLLAIFLGGLGIHKFYAGKIGTGIAYLLFCWTGVPAIIAFIEFIIGLVKPADDNGMIIV